MAWLSVVDGVSLQYKIKGGADLAVTQDFMEKHRDKGLLARVQYDWHRDIVTFICGIELFKDGFMIVDSVEVIEKPNLTPEQIAVFQEFREFVQEYTSTLKECKFLGAKEGIILEERD